MEFVAVVARLMFLKKPLGGVCPRCPGASIANGFRVFFLFFFSDVGAPQREKKKKEQRVLAVSFVEGSDVIGPAVANERRKNEIRHY